MRIVSFMNEQMTLLQLRVWLPVVLFYPAVRGRCERMARIMC